MSNKTLLVILAIMIVVTLIYGWNVTFASNDGGGGGISLSTNPNPLQPGPATFFIDIKDKNGKPVENATVSFDLNMTTMNMGTQQGNATSQGNGRYSAVGTMSMRGPWRVKTTVTKPDGSVENKDFIVNVP